MAPDKLEGRKIMIEFRACALDLPVLRRVAGGTRLCGQFLAVRRCMTWAAILKALCCEKQQRILFLCFEGGVAPGARNTCVPPVENKFRFSMIESRDRRPRRGPVTLRTIPANGAVVFVGVTAQAIL